MAGSNDHSGRTSGQELPSTSTSLLEGLKLRDANAWERMVALYYPLIFGWCRRGQIESQAIPDVCQEVFAAVAGGIEKFRRDRETDSFHGWLRAVTRNKVGDYWRTRLRQEQAIGGSGAAEKFAQVPALEDTDDNEVTSLTHRALDQIRPEFESQTWDSFWRVVVDGDSPGEVAAVLGVTVNAVYKAKARVFRRLREELGEYFE